MEYTEKYMDNFFKFQGKMLLNVENVLVKVSKEQP